MEHKHIKRFVHLAIVFGFLFANIAVVDAAKTPVKTAQATAVVVPKKTPPSAPAQKPAAAPVKKAAAPAAKTIPVGKAPAPKQVIAVKEPILAAPTATPVAPQAQGPIFPGRLIIPKIGVNAPVVALGLEPDGKMDVPDNYTEVGWYKLGAKPGDVGSAVMGAHVDNGGSINGVFKNLKSLVIGDEISVTDADGKMLTFRVSERRVVDYREKSTGDIFGNVGKKRLNLITCFGTYMPSADTYDQRLIVFADLVE